jgi:hypothetical protein
MAPCQRGILHANKMKMATKYLKNVPKLAVLKWRYTNPAAIVDRKAEREDANKTLAKQSIEQANKKTLLFSKALLTIYNEPTPAVGPNNIEWEANPPNIPALDKSVIPFTCI